jgi:hypothetical protein
MSRVQAPKSINGAHVEEIDTLALVPYGLTLLVTVCS